MTDMTAYTGKSVRVFTNNSFKFEGKCLRIEGDFLTLFDDRTQRMMSINKSSISRVEVIA